MVIRSPKWFRKVLDFEFVTGKDLYPDLQLHRKEVEQKELDEIIKDKNLLKLWNEEWSKILDKKNYHLRYDFERYLKDKGLYKSYLTYQDGIELIKKSFESKKNYFIINDFVSWLALEQKKIADFKEKERQRVIKEDELRKRREAEQRAQKLKDEYQRNFLEDFLRKIKKDFFNNPYSDKISTERIGAGSIKFSYIFENGDTFSLLDDELKVYNTKSIYRLGFHFRSLFIDLANEIIRKSVNRSINKAKVNENNDTTNPHLKRLNTLNDQIKIRQIQLNKLSKTDPNRDSLKNELDNYIRIRDRIKKEHSL